MPPLLTPLLVNLNQLYSRKCRNRPDHGRCLELNPECPANLRQGIGLCYFKKGRMDLARKAFQRVLQVRRGV